MPAGLSDTGLQIKTQPEIEEELKATQKANIGPNLSFGADSLLGNLNGIFSDQLASAWEALRDVYNSFFPDTSFGYSLSELVKLNGVTRNPATFSEVSCTVNVNPGTYAAGVLVAIVNGRPDSRFKNKAAVTNGGGGPANVVAVFVAEESGPVAAPAGSLVIGNPVAGWNSITNALDATLGEPIETDEDLRQRRMEAIATGSTTADAIRSAIIRELSDNGVKSVIVLVNDGDTPDVNGVPGHSFEAIVYGPDAPTADDDQAVAEVIAANKADGIRAYGTTTKVVEDDSGNELNIGLTRPTTVAIWVTYNLTVDSSYAGNQAIHDALNELETELAPGQDVNYFRVACVPFHVAGVLSVDSVTIGLAAIGQGTASIPIAVRQVAAFDSSRNVINTTVV